MKIVSIIKKYLKEFKRQITTNRNAKLKKSDVERWKEQEALFDDWNERTKIMAKYIKADGRVLEFGAAKLALKKYLPNSVTYTPSDVVDRGEGTIVCDLNAKNYPDFDNQNVIFFSGVLEYIFDVPHLINYLSNKTEKFIVSYCTLDYFSSLENRKINGWVNAYTNKEFKEVFKTHNFNLTDAETWRHQNIYVFEKE